MDYSAAVLLREHSTSFNLDPSVFTYMVASGNCSWACIKGRVSWEWFGRKKLRFSPVAGGFDIPVLMTKENFPLCQVCCDFIEHWNPKKIMKEWNERELDRKWNEKESWIVNEKIRIGVGPDMKREGEMDQCGMSRRVGPDMDWEESWTGYGLRGELDRIWNEM